MRPGEPPFGDRGFILRDARDLRDESYESTQPDVFDTTSATTSATPRPEAPGASLDRKVRSLGAHQSPSTALPRALRETPEQAVERQPVSADRAYGNDTPSLEFTDTPSPEFTSRLRAQVIEYAHRVALAREQRSSQQRRTRRTLHALPPHVEITPQSAPVEDPLARRLARLLPRLVAYVRQAVNSALLSRHAVEWAIAASLIVMITLTSLTVRSGLGQPLYHIVIAFTHVANGEQAAQDRLQEANTALNTFEQVARQRDEGKTLSDLDALTKANSRAYSAIGAVKDDEVRRKLTSQFVALRKHESASLRDALPYLGWLARARVTIALRGLNLQGADIISVDFAQITSPKSRSKSPHANGQTVIVVSGDGFVKGAVLLFNGAVAGKVGRITGSTLTARLFIGSGVRIDSIGVGLPDGTAAITKSLDFVEPNTSKNIK